MNNAPFSGLVLDGRRLTYANPTGVLNRARIGPLNHDDFYEGLPTAYTERVMAINARVVAERAPIVDTFALADADGTLRHWHTVRFPVEGDGGRPIVGMFAIDVSAVHQALEAKEAAQRQVQQTYKMALLGEMAGGIAHEINNPISIIMGKGRQLQEMLDSPSLDVDEAKEFAETMVRTGKRIVGIVNGLRTISRRSDDDPCQWTEVAPIVDGTIAIVAAKFRDAEVKLIIPAIDPGLGLECRPTEVCQVLTNLLGNALDAVETTPEKWVKVSVEAAADAVHFVVEDSGPGVPAGLRSKIMNPFFTTKEVGKGTGLGLSISRGLVEAHGGSLQLDENSPQTRFVAAFPQQQRRRSLHT